MLLQGVISSTAIASIDTPSHASYIVEVNHSDDITVFVLVGNAAMNFEINSDIFFMWNFKVYVSSYYKIMHLCILYITV